jgi:hypothetical protein
MIMKRLYLVLPVAFALLASLALGAEQPEYVVGVKGMT